MTVHTIAIVEYFKDFNIAMNIMYHNIKYSILYAVNEILTLKYSFSPDPAWNPVQPSFLTSTGLTS